jgi:hypothetical protein
LRTALSSRLRGAVVTVPASHGLGMACTFHFFKIGGRTGAGKWLGLGWGRAIKPAFGVETFVVIYAIEVMNIINNFFEILLGPACYIIFPEMLVFWSTGFGFFGIQAFERFCKMVI